MAQRKPNPSRRWWQFWTSYRLTDLPALEHLVSRATFDPPCRMPEERERLMAAEYLEKRRTQGPMRIERMPSKSISD